MRKTLLLRLLLINLPVLGLAIGIIWFSINTLAANYFSALMEEYRISPDDTHAMFLDATRRYMLGASAVAAGLAALLSVALTRHVLKPMRAIQKAAQRLAQGDRAVRVPVSGRDEIAELGEAFNAMAQSLEGTERLRRMLVADVAHELRTPLTNLRGYLEGLADGVIAPSARTLDMLHGEVRRLGRLVEDMHQLSQMDAAEVRIERRELDLNDLVERAVDLKRVEAMAKDIEIRTEIAPDAVRLCADPDRLMQILLNLLENANQFTPSGGTIIVETRLLESAIAIGVRNSGSVITQEDLPFIFERFFRADRSRSRISGGAGIGLAIVKGLAQAHGGRVAASSAGGMTRVWVELPR